MRSRLPSQLRSHSFRNVVSSLASRVHIAAASTSALVLTLVGAATPVAAATPAALSLTVTAAAPSTPTGTPVDFTIQYDCSGGVPCDGATVTVPLPNFVSANRPDWGFGWWNAPALTSSPDISSAAVANDGTATFTFKNSVATGTSGTLGVRYTPTTQTTPDGATLTVTASAAGGNITPTSATGSTKLTAGDHTAKVSLLAMGSLGHFYLDQNLTISTGIGLLAPTNTGVEGIDTVDSYTMILPTGAQFVSSDLTPDSINGETVTWKDVPATSTNASNEPGRRAFDTVVNFPSAAFGDGQNVTVRGAATGTSISGAAIAASGSEQLPLEAFVETISPTVQVITENYQYLDANVGRGVPYVFDLYLNNYNSTTTAASAVVSADIPAAFAVSSFTAAEGTVIRWTTTSGATGSFTSLDGTSNSLDKLGLAKGDALAHVDLDYGALPGATGRNSLITGTTTDTSVGSVKMCATTVLTSSTGTPSSASGCGAYTILDPFVFGAIYLSGPTGSDTYRPGETINWTASVANGTRGAGDLKPVVAMVAPAGTSFPSDPFSWDTKVCTPDPSYGKPITTIEKKAVSGRDALLIRWPDAPSLAPGASLTCPLNIKTTVTNAPAGEVTASAYLGDDRGPISSSPFTSDVKSDTSSSSWAQVVRDDRKVLPGSTGSSIAFRSTATAATGVGASLTSALIAKGSLDKSFVAAPQVAATESGKSVSYKLPVANTGNVPLTDVVLYDILPFVGDTGVSDGASSQSRGSQFAPTLLGAVAAPDGFTVEYSSSTNPCRPEVNAKTAGCVDDWTATPADYSTVRALKLVQNRGGTLAPGAESDFAWSMQIGQDVPAAQTAFNSVAFAATRADNGKILSAEPAPVGVETTVSDLEVTVSGGVAKPDSTVALPLTVTNHGPSATTATVVITASEGFTLGLAKQAPNSIGWTCDQKDDAMTCVSSAPLASGATGVSPVTLTVGKEGETGTVTATVSGPYPDPDLGNNTATASFLVSNETKPVVPRTVPPTLLPPIDVNTLTPLASTGSTVSWIGAALAGLLIVAGAVVAVRRRSTP